MAKKKRSAPRSTYIATDDDPVFTYSTIPDAVRTTARRLDTPATIYVYELVGVYKARHETRYDAIPEDAREQEDF
jgi:hypothetical protein